MSSSVKNLPSSLDGGFLHNAVLVHVREGVSPKKTVVFSDSPRFTKKVKLNCVTRALEIAGYDEEKISTLTDEQKLRWGWTHMKKYARVKVSIDNDRAIISRKLSSGTILDLCNDSLENIFLVDG